MKKIFVLLMCSLFSSPLLAGGGNNVSSLNEYWGNASDLLCGSHSIGNLEKDVCLNQDCKPVNNSSKTDENVIQLWVAMNVTEGGAKFCPVRIDGRNEDKGSSWTTYYRYSVTDDECIWLCKDGYGGTDCSETDGDYVCDKNKNWTSFISKFTRTYDQANAANIEDSVAMFSYNKYKKCYGHAPEEHDRILMVTRWARDAQNHIYRGAFVRQMMVRAERSGWKEMESWIDVYPATNSSEILVCMTGYKPNDTKTNCVEINATRCKEQNLCAGYETGFDETIHTMKPKDRSRCYVYRCKEDGKAFASSTDRSCVDCPETLRSGPNGTDGTCLKCDLPQVYNGSSCGEAVGYSKTDLMYGKGKTRSNANEDIDKQCWTILDTVAYKSCVKGVVQKDSEGGSEGGSEGDGSNRNNMFWNGSASMSKVDGLTPTTTYLRPPQSAF